jgi:NAD(P)-dependent dehydrogenase (short-subunit alcohol dehydrogenase family)
VELRDRVAVVTGGASGIGRALARRFAEEGARGVAVADLDGAGAEAVAAQIGERAFGVRCDVTSQDDLNALIDRATDELGPIDLFCANAGVGTGTGLDTPYDVWDLAFDVTSARTCWPRGGSCRSGSSAARATS